MENKDSSELDSTQKENTEKDHKVQEEVKNETIEYTSSNDGNLNSDGSGQQQTIEGTLTNSNTCELSDQHSTSNMDVDEEPKINMDSKCAKTTEQNPTISSQETQVLSHCEAEIAEEGKTNEVKDVHRVKDDAMVTEVAKKPEIELASKQDTFTATTEDQQIISEEPQNISEDQQNISEERKNISEEQQNISEEQQNISEEQQNISEEQQNISEERQNISEEQQRISEEQQNISEVQQNISEKQQNMSEEQQNIAEEQQNKSEKQQNISEEQLNTSQEQQNISEETQNIAEKQQNVLEEAVTSITIKAIEPVVNVNVEAQSEKTLNDAPQIIENLIIVKGFLKEQQNNDIVESQTDVAPQPESEKSMHTNEKSSLENTSLAEQFINNTLSVVTSLPPQTSITPSTQTGLSMLAQYDSDDSSEDDDEDEDSDVVLLKSAENEIERISDSESVVEVPTSNRDYRNRVVEIDSDSDSESDSSDSDVASEVSYLADIRKAIDKSMEIDADADIDGGDDDEFDENGTKTKRQPPRVKGEFLLGDLPPIQDLHITVPEADCVELGKVHSIVDQLVLVNALPNSLLLDLDTVLFLDKGQRVLGEVFDVLGQVADPLYCVRFNSNKQILEKNIQVGDQVYVAPKTQYTQFVILSSLMKMRGSDASWENDVEPPPRYLDYSDDEQERDARARLRNRDRSTDHKDPNKRARADSERNSPSPSPSTSPSPRYNNYQGMRPRGGRGGYRPPRYQHPRHEYQQRPPTYNAGSWHSNYPHTYAVPQQNFAAFPPPHVIYAQPPPSSFGAYPPQAVAIQQPYPMGSSNLQQQQPPQQVFVLNPYAVRPPVLGPHSSQTSVYTTASEPPPPPPRDV